MTTNNFPLAFGVSLLPFAALIAYGFYLQGKIRRQAAQKSVSEDASDARSRLVRELEREEVALRSLVSTLEEIHESLARR